MKAVSSSVRDVDGLHETRGVVCADMPGLDGNISFVPFPTSNTWNHLGTGRDTSPSLSVVLI